MLDISEAEATTDTSSAGLWWSACVSSLLVVAGSWTTGATHIAAKPRMQKTLNLVLLFTCRFQVKKMGTRA